MPKEQLLLVGCGKMGSALLRGWLAKGISPERVTCVLGSESSAESVAEQYGVKAIAPDQLSSIAQPDYLILAVKPQHFQTILPHYRQLAASACVISVAAGAKIENIASILGQEIPVIRAMPNLPSIIGKGMTGMVRNSYVSAQQVDFCTYLFDAVGKGIWLEEEALINAVTAISGSGPAYVFYFVECLIESAISLGIPKTLAEELALQTVTGSAALLEGSPVSPSEWRCQVTSPGGTTEAGLDILMSADGISKIIRQATENAMKRSIDLSKF